MSETLGYNERREDVVLKKENERCLEKYVSSV